MFDTLILLTSPTEAAALSAVVRFRNPQLAIRHVDTLDALNALDTGLLRRARLVAFATAVIVPRHILDALGYGAYNFHPGPPEYPGWAPASFAVYERATTFGVTAHAMTERVDAGPIIGVQTFPVPPGSTVLQLEERTLILLAWQFWKLSTVLTTRGEPLPVLPVVWSGRKRSRRHYREMCELPTTITKDELDCRVIAFGGGHYGCDMTLTVQDHRFRYVAPEAPMPAYAAGNALSELAAQITAQATAQVTSQVTAQVG